MKYTINLTLRQGSTVIKEILKYFNFKSIINKGFQKYKVET